MKSERTVSLPNKLGMHARPAMLMVELASKYSSTISFSRDGEVVNGKVLISVLTIGAERGSQITISAEGDDAEEAVESLCGLVEIGFGEE